MYGKRRRVSGTEYDVRGRDQPCPSSSSFDDDDDCGDERPLLVESDSDEKKEVHTVRQEAGAGASGRRTAEEIPYDENPVRRSYNFDLSPIINDAIDTVEDRRLPDSGEKIHQQYNAKPDVGGLQSVGFDNKVLGLLVCGLVGLQRIYTINEAAKGLCKRTTAKTIIFDVCKVRNTSECTSMVRELIDTSSDDRSTANQTTQGPSNSGGISSTIYLEDGDKYFSATREMSGGDFLLDLRCYPIREILTMKPQDWWRVASLRAKVPVSKEDPMMRLMFQYCQKRIKEHVRDEK